MTKSVFADWVWLLEVDGTCRKLIASVYKLLLGKKYIPQTKSLEKKIVLIALVSRVFLRYCYHFFWGGGRKAGKEDEDTQQRATDKIQIQAAAFWPCPIRLPAHPLN